MKTKQFITFSLSAGDRKTFKKLCDEYWFFLWFITKDRLNYCWIVSTSKSCWGHLSCGCWAVTGSVMGCPVRLQFRCGPPSLSWSWSCGLPGPSGCHPVLLHCWAQGQLQRDLFQPRRGALLASWESPSVFSFFFGLSSHALCHKSKSTCCHALHVSQRLWAAVQELRSACLEGMVSVTCGFCNAKSRN